jgi:SET domain-containing protein
METKKTTVKHYRVGRACAGLGLFATRDIKKGEFIIEYTGEPISHEEADRRGGRYLFILNEKTVLDGKKHEHTGRYMNHACKPNCEAVVENDAHIMIYAIKNIKKDEEFTYDYGDDYVEDLIKSAGCRCHVCQK